MIDDYRHLNGEKNHKPFQNSVQSLLLMDFMSLRNVSSDYASDYVVGKEI